MSFPGFVAMRYLLARRKQAFISVISLISVFGVGLGVASLIVVIGVMNGMSTDLRDKILGVTAHLLITGDKASIDNYREIKAKAAGVEGVTGVMPFIYSEVMLSSRGAVKGVALRGIDPDAGEKVLSIAGNMVEGEFSDLAKGFGPKGPDPVIIGKELADRLGLRRGSMVNMLVPSGLRTATGYRPKVKTVRVAGVFQTGMYEYDMSLAYTTIHAAQDILGFTRDGVNGLEVKIRDVDKAPEMEQAVAEAIGSPPFMVRNWQDMNANLYAALKLEKTAIFIILVMIVLVGSFSIITTQIMLVMEKTKDIAILISMGATRKTIKHIFTYQGFIIGFTGTGAGFVLGLTVSYLLKRYQFIKLPKGIYAQDYLTVLLKWQDLALIGGIAILLCYLATLYPASQAAKLEPVEALRYE